MTALPPFAPLARRTGRLRVTGVVALLLAVALAGLHRAAAPAAGAAGLLAPPWLILVIPLFRDIVAVP